ncbi:MAG: RimK family alpha-L-glutamate ligase [Alphaproteobacteria bacterium]|nr:RimK family alpha-L-glutamate ligase [Alphaproteobacteria bacterium]
MKIFVVIELLRYEERLIIQELKNNNLNHEVVLADCFERAAAGNSLCLMRVPSYYKGCYISEYYRSKDIKVINNYDVLHTFGDKFKTDIFLNKKGYRTIESYLCFNKKMAHDYAKILLFPLIIKPLIGGFGKLVHIVRDKIELEQLFEMYESSGGINKRVYYIQKYVEILKDLRIIVVNGKIVASVERKNSLFKKNIHQGGNSIPYDLSDDVRNYISPLLQYFTDMHLGIDLLVSRSNDIYICDINPTFLFKDSMEASGVNIADHIVQHVKSLITI